MSKYITVCKEVEVEVDICINDLDKDEIQELIGADAHESYGTFLDEINCRCRLYGEPLREVVNDMLRDYGYMPLPQ